MELMMLHLGDVYFSSDHSADGEIFFSIGDSFFPGDHWFDMISDDLDQWLPRMISFARGHTDSCTLQFMDGPCQVKLFRSDNGKVTATCLWDGKAQIPKTEIDLQVLLDSVLKAVRKYRRISYEQTGRSPYSEELTTLRTIMCRY